MAEFAKCPACGERNLLGVGHVLCRVFEGANAGQPYTSPSNTAGDMVLVLGSPSLACNNSQCRWEGAREDLDA